MSATVLRKKSVVFEEAVKWTMDAVEEMTIVAIVRVPVVHHFLQNSGIGLWAWCSFSSSSVIAASRVVAIFSQLDLVTVY